MVVCSHGFGVDATDRGLFSDIASAFPAQSFDMFDYNHIDEQGDMTVPPLPLQAAVLTNHLRATSKNVTLLCHSQGCVTACLADLKNVTQIIFLAPPDNLDIARFSKIFGAREGATFNPEGVSSIPRRDRTTTLIGKDYLESISAVNTMELYRQTANNCKVTIIRAQDDEIVGKTSFPDVSANIMTIPGSHDFKDSRNSLMRALSPLLKNIVRSYEDSDYEQLKALYQHTEWYGGVFDEARDGRERLAKKTADDPEAILVYEQDGELLGTISIIEDGRVAWLYRFIVKDFDEHVTQQLYVKATSILKYRGHRQVLVYSAADNKLIDSRYAALGMHRGGNYTCYYQDL